MSTRTLLEPEIAPETTPVATPQGRLLSLDAFRGLTVAGMLLVNNSGPGSHAYPPLEHAPWHGFTPTDLVFPSFLFIAGVAIPLALGKRLDRGDPMWRVVLKVVWRGLVIVALGLILAYFPFFNFDWESTHFSWRDWSTLRYPGILQRIGVCYLAASLLYLMMEVRGLVASAVLLLVGYWAALTFFPAPGGEVGDLTRAWSLPSWVDRAVFGHHRYTRLHDPEGLLSTVPAIATTLIGVVSGVWIARRDRSTASKVAGIFAAGALLTFAGSVWSAWHPLNKPLWTSSYVLYAGGLSLTILGVCAWLIEMEGIKGWAWPFLAFGSNPILVFFGSGLMNRILAQDWAKVPVPNGRPITRLAWLHQHLFVPWFDPEFASLLYSLSYVGFWLLIAGVLYRYRVSIRV